MKSRYKNDSTKRCFLSIEYLKPHSISFINELSVNGYAELTISSYKDSIAHFATWLQDECILICQIDEAIIERFSKHKCCCPGGRKVNMISRAYMNRVKRFIIYLSKNEIISLKEESNKLKIYPHIEKFKENLKLRGLSNRTIDQYVFSINMLLPLLGDDTQQYDAECIRNVICDMAKKSSRCVAKKLTKALRSYLRFLTTEGICSPDLDVAVPTVAEWRLSSLPKYLTTDELNKVISSCNTSTKQGIRDLAIILLLSRLGLRAGDVINMSFADIDWNEGTLRVNGKGRKEVLLPLPQDVGEALIAYLNNSRPLVDIDKVFLCLKAPYRPFPFSNGISSVVSAAITRAGINNPPSRGASLLRHTAATTMLRKGATLETVSAILRHRSLDMTAYYAKVDIPRLMKIAQPWPEGAPC